MEKIRLKNKVSKTCVYREANADRKKFVVLLLHCNSIVPELIKMGYFRCVRCDLNFDDEIAFTYHASAKTNTPAVSEADEGEVVQLPAGVSPCVARVICRNCYRSYQHVKGYRGGS